MILLGVFCYLIQQTSWTQHDLSTGVSCTSLHLLSRTPAISREKMPDTSIFFHVKG